MKEKKMKWNEMKFKPHNIGWTFPNPWKQWNKEILSWGYFLRLSINDWMAEFKQWILQSRIDLFFFRKKKRWN